MNFVDWMREQFEQAGQEPPTRESEWISVLEDLLDTCPIIAAIAAGVDMTCANLSCVNLAGADLSAVDLRGAILVEAVLSGANLAWDSLTNADLRGADLRGACLHGAGLTDADLEGADLTGADLTDTDLCGADFTNAMMDGTDLTGAYLKEIIGNGNQIKSVELGRYRVVSTATTLAIGCEQHLIQDWRTFENDRIAKMADDAIAWWTEYRPTLVEMGIL